MVIVAGAEVAAPSDTVTEKLSVSPPGQGPSSGWSAVYCSSPHPAA